MLPTTAEILDGLNIEDATLKKIREMLVCSLGDREKMRTLIDELCQQHNLPGCHGFDKQVFCSLFIGAAYFHLDDYDEAIKRFESASSQFRIQGEMWNQYLVLELLGLALIAGGRQQQAIEAFEKAQRMLRQESRIHRSDYLHRYEGQIADLDNLILSAQLNPSGVISQFSKPQPSPNPTQTKQQWPTARITYRVNDFGHASREGKFVLDDELVSKMTVEEIKFDELPHRMYSLRGGHQITNTSGGDYRWLKVAGESMNCANPVPIEPDDYILAVLGITPQLGDIVIANLKKPPTPAERAGVIKRYHNEGLASESTRLISPIPLEEVEIRGVVIAVAKKIV